MARPKPDFPPAETIRALADAEGRLALRVTPGARSEGLAIVDGRLLARVRVPPEDGRANAAVLSLLGDALGLPASRLVLLRGATSREKLIQIAANG
jgi:uncharacterized protein YggU (UPF0235/DUF167 family)